MQSEFMTYVLLAAGIAQLAGTFLHGAGILFARVFEVSDVLDSATESSILRAIQFAASLCRRASLLAGERK